MPIWTYECVNENCKNTIEQVIVTTEEKKNCEHYLCNGPNFLGCDKCGHEMKRIMSIPAKGIVK